MSSIIQSKDLLIWFGTEDGLNKYDGYNLTVYKHNPSDRNSVAPNRIAELYEDSHGRLWIGSDGGGLSLYNADADNFINFTHDASDPNSISSNKVTSIFEDRKGILWVGTLDGGLNRFDFKTRTFTVFKHSSERDDSINGNGVCDILEDSKGYLWVALREKGLDLMVDRDKGIFKHHQTIPNVSSSISDNGLLALFEDSRGNFWIGTRGNGCNLMDRKQGTFKRYGAGDDKLNSRTVFCFTEDHLGNVWMGTENGGINVFNSNTKTFSYIKADERDVEGLNNGSIYSLYKDRQNNIYVGTYNGGVNIYNPERSKFSIYRMQYDENGLNHSSVLSVLEDENKLWIATDGGGINVLDRTSEKFTYLTHHPRNQSSIGSNFVLKLFKDNDGDLWVSCFNGGVSFYDKKKKVFRALPFGTKENHYQGISKSSVVSFLHDARGNIWMGTWGAGYTLFNKKENTYTQVYPGNNDKGISGYNVESIVEDNDGKIWLAISGGLCMYDYVTGVFTYFLNIAGDTSSISSNQVNCLYEDSGGKLWIGTNAGLNVYEKSKGTFRAYKQKDGLVNDVVVGILEDSKGNLWLSTVRGLSEFNPRTETFRNFNIRDGLQGNAFNKNSCYRNTKGELIFGGGRGFNIFHPDSLKNNSFKPPVIITGLQIFNKPVGIGQEDSLLKKPIWRTKELNLSYRHSVISFDFVALNYLSPDKNQYAYILEGFEKRWNYVGSQRKATYTNLEPGEYIFKVKASNNDGIWNEDGTALKINISPPFWKTWLAKILYFLLAIAIVIVSRNILVQRLKVRHRLEMDEIKIGFYANISHEFRTPLTLILGPLSQLCTSSESFTHKNKQLLYMMQKNGQRLLKLINQLMHIYELDAGFTKLSIAEAELVSFCKGIKEAFDFTAEKMKIKYDFLSSVNLANCYFDQDKMEKILMNLISNAFKYTHQGGNITVELQYVDNNISIVPRHVLKRNRKVKQFACISVKDSGKGIPKELQGRVFDRFYRVENKAQTEGTGIGLSLSRQLALLHHGDIILKSQQDQGSKFMVWIPVSRAAFAENVIHESKYDVNDRVTDMQTTLAFSEGEQTTTPRETQDVSLPILLIVEDNVDIRTYLSQHLRSTFQIEEAVDGREGLEKANSLLPDIIVSDVMMPNIDGVEMCTRLKEDSRTSHIPILMLTARADENFQVHTLERAHADDYITKPFSASVLLAKLKNILEQRETLKKKLYKDFIASPSLPDIPSSDTVFLKKAVEIVEANIEDQEFNVEKFGQELGFSQTNLYRKLQGLLGVSANQFIKDIRMKRAMQLLSSQEYSVNEIAYMVGFGDPKYFSRSFKREFGVLPTEFLASVSKSNSHLKDQ